MSGGNDSTNDGAGATTTTTTLDKFPFATEWIAQEEALLTKNVWLFARRKFTLLVILFTPGLLVLALSLLNDEVMKEHTTKPLAESTLLPTRCKVFNFHGQIDDQNPSCVTLMYGPSNPTTDNIMEKFTSSASSKSQMADPEKTTTAWKLMTDVESFADIQFVAGVPYNTLSSGADVVGMKNPNEIAKFMRTHLGRLDAALFFDTENDPSGSTYTLMLNGSVVGPYAYRANEPWHHLALQHLVNEAIVAHRGENVDIDVTIKPIRDLQDEQASIDGGNAQFDDVESMIPSVGHVFIIIGTMIGTLIVINTVTGEKRARIVGTMRMMGLHESAYWMSWMIILWVLAFLSAGITATFGALTPLKIFKECDWGVHFVALFFFFTSMHSMALCISSIVHRMSWVNIWSFCLFTLAVIFSTMANTITNGTFWNASYSPKETTFWKVIFFLMPWFHYCKIFTNVLSVTKVQGLGLGQMATSSPSMVTAADIQYALDNNSSLIVNATQNSTYYTWERIYQPVGLANGEPFPEVYDINGDPIGGRWFAPSVYDSMRFMFALNIVYYILAWYLGQVITSHTGAVRKPWFFLDLRYWGLSKHARSFAAGDRIGKEQILSRNQQSLRIYKMSKSFKSVTALKELSLTMRSNEIFCLLGHNGAGKTTAINCLTGLHNPTYGEAFVFGHSIKNEINKVQKLMGVCPQHDVLFSELTAAEHLRFWARFKGVVRNDLNDHVKKTLETISLQGKGNNLASTFSGGMKRRLSVGISAMGNPKVIFLDEPTTGLDPLSRRRVWAMIERLKEGRVIVLTTHSMEEADALSDEIGILSNGRLRALGSSFFLKNKFGGGYTITLTCDEADTERVIAMTMQKLPGSETLANAAGALSFGLSKRVVPLIPKFFSDIENEAKEKGKNALIKEWGISNTRLEEVFLRLVAQNKSLNADTNAHANDLNFEEDIIIKRADGKDTVRTKTVTDGLQKDFEPIDLYSGIGVPLKISEQMYRLLDGDNEEKVDTPGAEGVGPANDMDCFGTNSTGDAKATVSTPQNVSQRIVQVQIPANSGPGMTLEILTPDAQKLHVTLPEHVIPGQVIQVPYTPNVENIRADTQGTGYHQVNNPQEHFSMSSANVGGFGKQICALYMKDVSIQKRMKWSNCCRCCCMVFVSLVMLLVSAIVEGTRVNSKRADTPGLCKGGLNLAGDGAEALTGRSFNLCNTTDWNDYVTGGKCHYRGDCDLNREAAVYSMPKAVPHSLPVDTAIKFVNESMLTNYTNIPDFCVLGNTLYGDDVSTGRSNFIRIWVENKETVSDPLSLDGLVGINTSAATLRNMPFWFKYPAVDANAQFQHIDFCKGINISFHQNIEAVLLASQLAIAARQIPNAKLECQPTFKDPEMVYENRDGSVAAIDELRKLFPDYAVTFEKSKITRRVGHNGVNAQLQYTIHTFASNKDSWSDYKWARILYGEAVAGQNENICNEVKVFSFNPADNGYNGARRHSTPQLPYMFLSTQILNAVLFDTAVNGVQNGAPTKKNQIKAKITAMPIVQYPQAAANNFQIWFVLVVFPVMTMIFFPMIVKNVSMEFRERLVVAIRLQSGKLSAYWIAIYLFHYTLYACVTFIFVGFQALIGNSLFVNCDVGQLIAVLAFWGHAQIGMGIFLAMVLSRTRLQMLGAYIVMILVMLLAPTLWSARLNEWGAWWIFPPTAFIRGITLVLEHSAQPNTIVQSCGHMFWTGCTLGLIGVVMHYVTLNDDAGTSLINTAKICRKLKLGNAKVEEAGQTAGNEKNMESKPLEQRTFIQMETPKDEDVLKEEERVRGLDKADVAIKLVKLRKVFAQSHPPKVAVSGISVGISTGEVFALLGPNGAGKTTTIHMLSGNTRATSGQAYINGHDVTDGKKGLENARKVMGLCPQFDTVWPTLTVQEHLLLYARLKGIPMESESAAAQWVAAQVELDGDAYYQPASQLSGGMRRRLSLGIALVGNPKIVFLDEPTTGLDPETKLGVWRILEKQRDGRAIILTTHSMEEADALSTRIGIMADGTLRCVGTQLHLKNKFGSGYRLTMTMQDNFDAAFVSSVVDPFVKQEISPDALRVHSDNGHGSLVYSIKEGTVNISDTFKVMEAKRKEFVKEWALQQTSLESVFLRIAKAAEANTI